jgi:NAD(P)-dependent dehydrogenase (short-subunit alcohol dehydrogenase family)
MLASEASTSRLFGKNVLITGGNSGIGLAVARLFEQEGGQIAITVRRQEAVAQFEANSGKGTFAILADASDCSCNHLVMQKVADRFGKLDVLFLNAGVGKASAFDRTSAELYDLQFDLMVKGPFFAVRAALPYLNDGASIIFNCSVSSGRGTPGLAVYGAAKAALRSLVRTLAAELAVRQVRVNAISPGLIDTPIWLKTGATPDQIEEVQRERVKRIPLGRIGTASEVAAAALFLASSDSSYVTGIELPVDGGWAQV